MGVGSFTDTEYTKINGNTAAAIHRRRRCTQSTMW
jgi:hypothetical protein